MLFTWIFVVGGFCGWMIDTAYRSLRQGRHAPNTWIPFFSIIYASGALFLYILFTFFSISVFSDIIVGTILAICLELMSGIVALVFLNRRFWDYRSNRYNFRGFVDAEHSFYWLILVAIYRTFFIFMF